MAKELMERETLQAEDIAKIFKPVKKLPKRAQWLSKKSRPVSKQGPIAIPDKGSNAARARVAKAEAAAEAKAAAKKPAAKKPAAKKATPKKPVAKKAAPKRTVAKKK
jgi:cell division protease FtsH